MSNIMVAGLTAALVSVISQDATIIPTETDIVSECLCSEENIEYVEIGATAYYNKYNSVCADGTDPHYGTLAGKREWLGKTVTLYDSEYTYIGEFTFHDVGYGKPTGYGNSKLHKGKTLGDIETGETIDIFFDTYNECIEFGRQRIYIVW